MTYTHNPLKNPDDPYSGRKERRLGYDHIIETGGGKFFAVTSAHEPDDIFVLASDVSLERVDNPRGSLNLILLSRDEAIELMYSIKMALGEGGENVHE